MWPLMSVPASGSRALRTARAAFWWSRCCGGAVAAPNVSSRNVTPTPSVPPTSSSVAGVHGLPFIISANRANRTEMTLPSWARPATACSRNCRCSSVVSAAFSRQASEGPAEGGQHLSGVVRVEQVDGGGVLPFDQADFQLPHEPGGRHPEVVPHHDEALHAAAVALPQGLRPARFPASRLACSHCSNWSSTISTFLALGQPLPAPQSGQRVLQCRRHAPRAVRGTRRGGDFLRVVGLVGSVPEMSDRQVGNVLHDGTRSVPATQALSQGREQPGLGLVGGRLDVDGDDVPQPAAAAGRP